jgi:ketosteroid isomerase-like protein
MKNVLRLSMTAALAFLVGQSGVQGAPASDGAAIKQVRLAQNAAIAAHRIDEIASYWTDDVSICRALGAQLSGKAAYRQLFVEDDPKNPNVIVYVRTPNDIEVSSHWELAFETGVWSGHIGSAEGPVALGGRYSAQWVKRNGHWLIRSEVYVALNAAGPGLTMKSVP